MSVAVLHAGRLQSMAGMHKGSTSAMAPSSRRRSCSTCSGALQRPRRMRRAHAQRRCGRASEQRLLPLMWRAAKRLAPACRCFFCELN